MKKFIAILTVLVMLGIGIGVGAKTGKDKLICPCGCKEVAIECMCEEAVKLLKSFEDV